MRHRLPRFWSLACMVGSAALLAVLLTLTASAQTQDDVRARDSLIANQENLLNTYRCLFNVDTAVVPGGCANRQTIVPGVAPQNPTTNDIAVRDGLIQQQEALLNVYRCAYSIDVQLVPGGCLNTKPSPTATPLPTSVPTATPTAVGWDVSISQERSSGYQRPSGSHGGRCGSGQDLDHVVPLLEAWESGVNDLSGFNKYQANHYCMPSSANRSKGSSEPHEWSTRPQFSQWLSSNPDVECVLIQRWASVKTAWSMSADNQEHAYLSQALNVCGTGGILPTPTPVPTATPKPTPTPTPRPSGGCTHWHSGQPKHTHPGTNHDGTHKSGKCRGY